MPSAMVRPGSKSRANVRKGSLGTWEILLSPLLDQCPSIPHENSPGTPSIAFDSCVPAKASLDALDCAAEAVEMDRGSRSALIVAPESRETDPRKPVSSQGGGARRGESLFSLIWIEISNKRFWELSGETTMKNAELGILSVSCRHAAKAVTLPIRRPRASVFWTARPLIIPRRGR